jgi:hypothetical protein
MPTLTPRRLRIGLVVLIAGLAAWLAFQVYGIVDDLQLAPGHFYIPKGADPAVARRTEILDRIFYRQLMIWDFILWITPIIGTAVAALYFSKWRPSRIFWVTFSLWAVAGPLRAVVEEISNASFSLTLLAIKLQTVPPFVSYRSYDYLLANIGENLGSELLERCLLGLIVASVIAAVMAFFCRFSQWMNQAPTPTTRKVTS